MKRFLNLVALLVLLALAAAAYLLLSSGTPPQITLTPASGMVGPSTELELNLRATGGGLEQVMVSVRQGATVRTLLTQAPAGAPAEFSTTFRLPDDLQDGPLSLEIQANDDSLSNMGKGALATATMDLVFDKRPPILSVLSMRHNVDQGGSGLVLFSADEPLSRSGVQVGEYTFPAYQMEEGWYACLFAFPYNLDKADFSPRIYAEDRTGNSIQRTFPFHADPKKYKTDTIRLPDSFLEAKKPEFSSFFPDENNPLEVFLRVNRDMRRQNRAALLQLGKSSVPRPLWDGAFSRLPRAANRAGFAEHRTYTYKGEKVDEQTHLGVDLASLKHAEVPAANRGVVVYAGYMGIYGNCVVLDHGLGLMTLYAHLSSIDVRKGQTLGKNDILGRTGTTGLAGGDHLHYGVLVAGLPVNPLEWWDATWIENNVSVKLRGEK